MAVFTAVSLDDLSTWIEQFPLGKATALQGIASGIENSNFFLTTERGEFVLTIFENLSFEQLPFYLELMRHLAERGVLVPAPVATLSGSLVADSALLAQWRLPCYLLGRTPTCLSPNVPGGWA